MSEEKQVEVRPSLMAPQVYAVCKAHGFRYCRKCGTAVSQQQATPEQWAEAYRRIQESRPAKEKPAAG